jgi:hypothetical protein
MKKLSEYHFTDEEFRNYYARNQKAINYHFHCDSDDDLLNSPEHQRHVTQLVKQELRRIADFKEKHPCLEMYFQENFVSDLDYIFERMTSADFLDGQYRLKDNKDLVIKAAATCHALLKWIPERFRSDPEVLLAAYFSNGNSFMCLDAFMSSASFPFVTQEMWDGNCYEHQQQHALEQLIAIVEAEKNFK